MSSITFNASFPPIQSAIKISGSDGARIQLDIPQTDMEAVAALLGLTGCRLKVTVGVVADKDRENGHKPKHTVISRG